MIRSTIVPQKVLVVAHTVDGIAHVIAPLREAGCSVELAMTATEAIGRAAALEPDLVVIEDQLEDVNSVELSIQIRSIVSPERAPTFIMACSSDFRDPPRSAEPDALPTGDSAPRRDNSLVARIASLLEAEELEGAEAEPERVQCQGVCLDRLRHRAWIKKEVLHLTPTEFKLLWALTSRPGHVLSREDLTTVCKGSANAVQARTIDAHVKSIRRKLKQHARLIETVHGVGYRFHDEA